MTRVCLDCTTAYAVGAPRCPQCGSERGADEGSAAALGIRASLPVDTEEDSMPKITRHGGASVPPEVEGGEDVSAGTSTETSSEKPSATPEKSETGPQKPARTTGSRSRKAKTASGSAGGATTGGHETGAADD